MKYDITKFKPCSEALEFYNSYKTTEEAWQNCPRGDWMLWIAKKLDVDIKLLTRSKALCAQTVIHLMKDERSRKAIQVALDFSNDLSTIEELKDAAVCAAYAAYAAAYAATHAYAAAAAAADADADSAYAAYVDAKRKNQKQTADICRRVLTKEVFRIIKNEHTGNTLH